MCDKGSWEYQDTIYYEPDEVEQGVIGHVIYVCSFCGEEKREAMLNDDMAADTE